MFGRFDGGSASANRCRSVANAPGLGVPDFALLLVGHRREIAS
jgi:hypothetical protein